MSHWLERLQRDGIMKCGLCDRLINCAGKRDLTEKGIFETGEARWSDRNKGIGGTSLYAWMAIASDPSNAEGEQPRQGLRESCGEALFNKSTERQTSWTYCAAHGIQLYIGKAFNKTLTAKALFDKCQEIVKNFSSCQGADKSRAEEMSRGLLTEAGYLALAELCELLNPAAAFTDFVVCSLKAGSEHLIRAERPVREALLAMVKEEEEDKAKEFQDDNLDPVDSRNPLAEEEPDSMVIRAETQLSKYYKSTVHSPEKYPGYLDNPRIFWKVLDSSFNVMARLARCYLCIQATSS
ncbi:MAG: hypothetical protein J3R72DRAFT_491835 [Linnemannia gamsii]|nr:MAG: hypothetical protein J3R72DRAFT_491835 [Linnemannia gamsii]